MKKKKRMNSNQTRDVQSRLPSLLRWRLFLRRHLTWFDGLGRFHQAGLIETIILEFGLEFSILADEVQRTAVLVHIREIGDVGKLMFNGDLVVFLKAYFTTVIMTNQLTFTLLIRAEQFRSDRQWMPTGQFSWFGTVLRDMSELFNALLSMIIQWNARCLRLRWRRTNLSRLLAIPRPTLTFGTTVRSNVIWIQSIDLSNDEAMSFADTDGLTHFNSIHFFPMIIIVLLINDNIALAFSTTGRSHSVSF